MLNEGKYNFTGEGNYKNVKKLSLLLINADPYVIEYIDEVYVYITNGILKYDNNGSNVDYVQLKKLLIN